MQELLRSELKRVVAYAEALERECARLGNPIANDRNNTLKNAKRLISEAAPGMTDLMVTPETIDKALT